MNYLTKDPRKLISLLGSIGYTNPDATLRFVDSAFEKTTNEEILAKLLEVLNNPIFKYAHVDKSFPIFKKAYQKSQAGLLPKRIGDDAEKIILSIASYDLNLWEKGWGYTVQEKLLKQIVAWHKQADSDINELVFQAFGRLLNCEIQGEYSDHKRWTMRFGPIPVTDDLKRIRRGVLDHLLLLFEKRSDAPTRKRIISTLLEATKTPIRGKYGRAHEEIAEQASRNIIDFFTDYLKKEHLDFEVLQEVESLAFWIKRRHGKSVGGIEKLEAVLDDRDYAYFRTLVGRDVGLMEEDKDWKTIEQERNEKIDSCISEINDSTFGEWRDRILRIAEGYSLKEGFKEDYKYHNFRRFLVGLGRKNPYLAKRLVESLQSAGEVRSFLCYLIVGIRESDHKELANTILDSWIASKQRDLILEAPYSYWGVDAETVGYEDVSVIAKLLDLKLPEKDAKELQKRVVRILLWIYQADTEKSEALIRRVIQEGSLQTKELLLSELELANVRSQIILRDLSEEVWGDLVEILVETPGISHREEEFLSIYLQRVGVGIVEYFKKRVQHQRELKEKPLSRRYDAIPFQLGRLAKDIRGSKHYSNILEKLFEWHQSDDWLDRWESSHLIHNISPGLGDPLEDMLKILIKTEEKESILRALNILDTYQGTSLVDDICKFALTHSKGDEDLYRAVGGILFNTGVVAGERGFINVYEERISRLEKWKEDENPYVKDFARKYIGVFLDKIAQEEKRVEETMARRKKGY